MKFTRALPVVLTLSLCFGGGAQADTVVNPFSGQWATMLGGSTPGTVKFSAIDASTGASALQAMGGHPCGQPTTYYHGDFTDQPDPSTTQTGTMTACTESAGHLVGRYRSSDTTLTYPGGDIDITLNSAQNGFDGFYTADDPSFAGMQFRYSGTFQSHFPGDGCCTPGGGGGGSSNLAPPTVFCTGLASDFAAPIATVCEGPLRDEETLDQGGKSSGAIQPLPVPGKRRHGLHRKVGQG